MHTIPLRDTAERACDDQRTKAARKNLAERLEELLQEKGRVYWTNVTTFPNHDYIFVTTSKNMHLALGRIGLPCLENLVTILESEMGEGLTLIKLELGENDAVLVTRTCEGEGTVIYNLSPTN